MNRRKGFGLQEAICAIAIVGCLIVIAVASFVVNGTRNNTLEAKQLKVSSALQSITKELLFQGQKITVTQACDPLAIRNLYLSRISNAKIAENIVINGRNLPALEIPNYGIIAFESSAQCEDTWNANPNNSSDLSTGGVVTNPVVIYSVMDETTNVTVPNNVTANSSNPSSGNNSVLTPSTMAFTLNSNGLKNNYTASSATSTTLGVTSIGTTKPSEPTTMNLNHNTTGICKAGDNYSYISSACTDEQGAGISVNFYEMLNEISCQVSYCPGNGYTNSGELITSGQINMLCKTGDGNVGQCSCPEGKKYYVSRYKIADSNIRGICVEDCSVFNMVQVSNNQCDCADGAVWNTTSQRCVVPGSCSEDYLKWDENQGTCVCKSATELLDMDPHYFASCEVYDATKTTEGCKRIRPNWDKSTGTCVCPIPFTQDGADCTCQAPRIINQQGECICHVSKVTLADNEIFVDDDYNPNCKVACDSSKNEIPDTDKLSCICKTNQVRVNDVCSCVAPFALNANNECVCPSPKLQEGNTCECPAIGTTEANAAIAGLQAQGDEVIYDPSAETCFVACDTQNGFIADENHTACICPSNMTNVNGVCQCLEPFALNTNNECVCPSPKLQEGNTCECPALGTNEATAIINQLVTENRNGIFNPTADSCVSFCDTSAGLVPNATRTGCEKCPDEYIPNETGSACVLACNDVVIGGVSVSRTLDSNGTCACKPWADFTIQERNSMILALDAQNAIYSVNSPTCTAQCLEINSDYETHTCTLNSDIITLECGEKCIGATAYDCQNNQCGCVSELDAREYDESEFKLNLGERNTWDNEAYFDYVAFCKTCVPQRDYDGVTVPASPIDSIGCICPDISSAKMQSNLIGNLVYDIQAETCATTCPDNTYAQLPLHDVCLPCDPVVADVVNENNVFSCQCNRAKTEQFISTSGINAIFVNDITVGCMEDCPQGLVARDGVCVCPQTNTTLINGTCQCRPDTAEYQEAIAAIKETLNTANKEYYNPDALATNCISVCNAPNYSYNEIEKTCECASPRLEPNCTCPSGQTMFDNGYLTETQYREAGELDCVRSCTVGQTHNTTTVVGYDGRTYAPYETCMCAHPFEWNATNKQCVCKEAWDFDTNTHECVCNLGRTYVDANNEVQCTCPLVMDNVNVTFDLIIENGNKSCECPTDEASIALLKEELRKNPNNTLIYDATANGCFSECDATKHLLPNQELNACVCDAANGFEMVDGQCVCGIIYQDATTGFTVRKDGSTGTCLCPSEDSLHTSTGSDMLSTLAKDGKIYNPNTNTCISTCSDFDAEYVVHACPGLTIYDTKYSCGPRCYGAKIWDCTSTPNQCHCATSMSYIPPADEFILFNGEERTWNTAYAENNYCKQCDIYRDPTQTINSATESLGCTCSPEMYNLRQPGQIVDEQAVACISDCDSNSYADLEQNICVQCNVFPFFKPDNANELCACADEETLDPAMISNWLQFGERYDSTQYETHCTSCVEPRYRNESGRCNCPTGSAMFNNGLLEEGQFRDYTKENCVGFCAAGKTPNTEDVVLTIYGQLRPFAAYETCVCQYPFVPNNENNEICECGLPWTPSQNGMSCECKAPFVQEEQNGIQQCLCPTIIGDIRQEMNEQKTSCSCPARGSAEANAVIAQLVAENQNRVYSPNTAGCIHTCDTANGFLANNTHTGCVCPNNMTNVNGVCQCLDPFVMNDGVCGCPAPRYQDEQTCVCPTIENISLSEGYIYAPDEVSCVKECDKSKFNIPNSRKDMCICDPQKAAYFYDTADRCGCPAGSTRTQVPLLSFDMINFEYDVYVCKCDKQCGPYDVPMVVDGTCQCVYDPLVVDYDQDKNVEAALDCGIDITGDGNVHMCATKGDKMLAINELNTPVEIDGTRVFSTETIDPFNNSQSLNAANGFEALYALAISAIAYADDNNINVQVISTDGFVELDALKYLLNQIGWDLGFISENNITTLEPLGHVSAISVNYYEQKGSSESALEEREVGFYKALDNTLHKVADIWVKVITYLEGIVAGE